MNMLRTAETEKYAHVTYFFNGGVETPFPREERLLVPSQKVATYDLMPEMSAPGVTDVLCNAIEKREHDFILCNYANGDMVGHTGSMPATIARSRRWMQCLDARRWQSAERVGCAPDGDRRSRQLRDDDRSGDGRSAHRPHDESGSVHRRRS